MIKYCIYFCYLLSLDVLRQCVIIVLFSILTLCTYCTLQFWNTRQTLKMQKMLWMVVNSTKFCDSNEST